MTPYQKLLKQEGTARRIESMQQSSATPSLHLWFLGVAEDCCMLSILLAVSSCLNSFWHGGIPTSYFIFNDFYTSILRSSTKLAYKLVQGVPLIWNNDLMLYILPTVCDRNGTIILTYLVLVLKPQRMVSELEDSEH